jgi:ligand-binding sensor domain-containing protein/signal transduction histidine kinase
VNAGLSLSFVLVGAGALYAEHLPVKSFTTADGLAGNRVHAILRDSRGFLWFGTNEGLSRFDGYQFTNYRVEEGMPRQSVIDMLESKDGEIWVATRAGLSQFQSTASVPNRPRFSLIPAGGPQGADLEVLFEDGSGEIWCGTDRGLLRLARARKELQPVDFKLPRQQGEDTRVLALANDRRGDLWIGTGTGLYRRHASGQIEQYTPRQGLPDMVITALFQDRQGRLWIGTHHGLGQIATGTDPEKAAVAHAYRKRDGLASDWINTIFQSSDGKIWLGTAVGLSELISEPGSDHPAFRSYGSAQGLTDAGVEAIAEDVHGNLWIGTEEGGVLKIARNGFTTYTEADGLQSLRIAAIVEDSEGKVCAVSRAPSHLWIQRFDSGRFAAVEPNFGRQIAIGWGWYQIALQGRERDWWFATDDGLFRFPKVGRLQQLTNQMPVHYGPGGVYQLFRAFEDSRGDIWTSTSTAAGHGVDRWQRGANSFVRSPQEEQELLPYLATAFAEDRSGAIWVGFTAQRVARFEEGRFAMFTTADGVPAGWIRAFHMDRAGRLWIASSEGGLSRIDDSSAAHPHFVTFTTANGLSSNAVQCIVEDRWGRIYAATARGVDRLEPALPGRIKHYTTADGLAPGELQAAFRDREGALWFGTSQGLSRLLPEMDRSPEPPPVRVMSVRIGGVAQPISDFGETEGPNFTLRPDQNSLQFDFVGLGFAPGEALKYQYKLVGTDHDWTTPLPQRSVSYADLPPGSYRFVVRAINSEGAASPKPAGIAFRILPPLWRRAWFQFAAFLLFALAAFRVQRYREGRLIELERVRTRVAADLHDDLGASLSYISIQSEVASRQQNGASIGSQSKALSEIATTARELVDSMSDIVWAIDPENDRLHDLAQRMRWFGGEVFQARDIQFEFSGPAQREDTTLRADLRREVFLVFKEAVNNIARHAGCRHVRAGLAIEGELLLLTLADDGRGFDADSAASGLGLKSMRQRARRLGGAIEIASRPQNGAAIILSVPWRRRPLWKTFLHRRIGERRQDSA